MPEIAYCAEEIREAIGGLTDNRLIDLKVLRFVRMAVAGICPTSDKGDQEFVVDISGCALLHVDSEELIWWQRPGADIPDDYVPLQVISDRALWSSFGSRLDTQLPREWTAFVWRIAVPLVNRLDLPTPWS